MEQTVEKLLHEARNYLIQSQRYIKGFSVDNLIKILVFSFYVFHKCRANLPNKQKIEFKRLFDGALHIVNLDQQVKEVMPDPLEYKLGREVEIINKLKKISTLIAEAELKKKKLKRIEENNLKKKKLSRAFGMVEKNRLDGALSQFNELSSQFPDDYKIHKEISWKLLELERLESISFLEKTVKINPKDAESFNALGEMLHKIKRYEPAAKVLVKAVEIDKNNTTYLSNLANAYINSREWTKAKKVLERLLRLDPQNDKAKEAMKFVSRLFRAG